MWCASFGAPLRAPDSAAAALSAFGALGLGGCTTTAAADLGPRPEGRTDDAIHLAPIRAIVPFDVDHDGNLDLIVGGNLYDVEANVPRADAGNGLWLRGDGRGHFIPVSPRASGFLAPRDVTGLTLLDTPTGKKLIVANSADSLQLFRIDRR